MTHPPRSSTSRRALLGWWLATATMVIATIVATLMIASPLLAAVPPPAFEAAFAQFQKAASTGGSDAIETAAEQFGKLAASDPADPVLLAYSGSATAMRATTTMMPWRKMGFADEGLAQIDKALAMLDPAHDTLQHRGVPASLEVRFTAASTFLRMPAMMNRQPRGTRLLDEVLKSPLLAATPVGFRASVWMRAAETAAADKHPDQARQWLQQVAASGAPQAAMAQARLKEMTP